MDDMAVDTVESAADFNESDVMFAQMMIPHHEQAIEMADIALDPLVGASDVVKSLATRIKAAQDPEITKMKAFLTTWKERLTPDSSMDHSDMMSGMLSAEDIKKLSSLRGAEFDREWMNGMIEHHEGAIEMAKDVLKDGKRFYENGLNTPNIPAAVDSTNTWGKTPVNPIQITQAFSNDPNDRVFEIHRGHLFY